MPIWFMIGTGNGLNPDPGLLIKFIREVEIIWIW